MNKRFFISVTASAALALAMAGSAFAGSGFIYQERSHNSSLRNLVIEPGADPSSVQLHFAGAERITFSGQGALEIINADGGLWRYRPEVYQVVNGKRKNVAVSFTFIGKDRVSLRVSKFDASAPLVVSPVKGPASTM